MYVLLTLLRGLFTHVFSAEMPTTFMRYFYLGAVLRWH